jgi:hypothetical protein
VCPDDARNVHDSSAVHANERSGIELFRKAGKGVVQQVGLRAAMQEDVVVRRLYPVDLIHRHELIALAVSDHQPLGPGSASGLDQPLEALRGGLQIFGCVPQPGPLDRRGQARFVERLQQVVHRVQLERLHRVFVVSGHEDHHGHPPGPHLANHL